MASHFVLRFIGKISWEGQANGLPPEIFANIVARADTREQLTAVIESYFSTFTNIQGMTVDKNYGRVLSETDLPKRLYVPFRWIVWMEPQIIPMVGELPVADEKGIQRLSDGTEPVKQ